MYNGGINPAFPRVGGKSLLKKKIVDEYFPEDYENMIYVEPFVGGETSISSNEDKNKRRRNQN